MGHHSYLLTAVPTPGTIAVRELRGIAQCAEQFPEAQRSRQDLGLQMVLKRAKDAKRVNEITKEVKR